MGCIYLLGDSDKENRYKIGVTRGDIEKRIKKLQTGNSGEIYLVLKYETSHPFLMENMLHTWYSNKKVLNEWFELDFNEVKEFRQKCEEAQDIINALEDNYYFKKKYGSATN